MRNVICPVSGQTISLKLCFCARSQNASKRAIIRSSTPAWPAGVSGRRSSLRNMRVSRGWSKPFTAVWISTIGWNSAQFAKTRSTVMPLASSATRSFSTSAASHLLHIWVAAWLAQ